MPGSATWVQNPISFLEGLRGSVDAICASHVLEHIPKNEVLPLLHAIKAALKPEGRLIIEVPNGDAPLANIMRYGDFTHEISYTERSLRQVMTLAGYPSVDIQPSRLPLDHPLRPIQLSIQLVFFTSIKLLCRILDTYKPNYLHASIICVASPA